MATALTGLAGAFKKLTGRSPAQIQTSSIISTYKISTPLGPMLAASVEKGICFLEFADKGTVEKELADLQKRLKASVVTSETGHIKQLRHELEEYFGGSRKKFSVPVHLAGSAFQERAWTALQTIPYGETRTYQQQAVAVGNPRAVRAVARANGGNRIAILVPCHRVIGSNGNLTGYSWGVERKQYLLKLEKS